MSASDSATVRLSLVLMVVAGFMLLAYTGWAIVSAATPALDVTTPTGVLWGVGYLAGIASGVNGGWGIEELVRGGEPGRQFNRQAWLLLFCQLTFIPVLF